MQVRHCQTFNGIDRKTAIIAALPMFLFGLIVMSITIFLSVIGGPAAVRTIGVGYFWHYLALAIAVFSLLTLLFAAAASIRNKLAIWSYPWLMAVLAGFIVSINLVLDDRVVAISQVLDVAIVALSLLACLVIGFYMAIQGWQHTGLFSIAFGGTLGLALCFFGVAHTDTFQRGLGFLAVLIGLVEAVLIYRFIYKSDGSRIGALIGVACINIAIAWQVEASFRAFDPARGISQFWYLAILLTGILIGGTLVGIPGQFVSRRASHWLNAWRKS